MDDTRHTIRELTDAELDIVSGAVGPTVPSQRPSNYSETGVDPADNGHGQGSGAHYDIYPATIATEKSPVL